MEKKKEMTEQERQIVRELGHSLYTVEYLETWINRNDNVMCNAVAALTAMGAKGYYDAVKMMAKQGMQKKTGYTVHCGGHNYLTLECDGAFVFCLDNCLMYAEDMIRKVEGETGMDFRDIRILGRRDDFQGLRFRHGGWKRDFWDWFSIREESDAPTAVSQSKTQDQ